MNLIDPQKLRAEIETDYAKYRELQNSIIPAAELNRLYKAQNNQQETYKLYCWPEFGVKFGGIRTGELTLITGDTGHGKTTFAANIAFSLIELGKRVLIYSLEMGPLAFLHYLRPMVKTLIEDDETREKYPVLSADVWTEKADFYAYGDSGHLDFDQLERLNAYCTLSMGCKVIIVDHFHCLTKSSWDAAKMEEAAMRLRHAASKLNVAILVIVHPSKIQGDRKERVIEMDDLKGSSGLKQYSDNVLSIFYDKKEKESRLHLHKIRHLDYGKNMGDKIHYKLDRETQFFSEGI